jgi:poly-gamma-glutamate synthesis protein (capsule biosynthesis protein)
MHTRQKEKQRKKHSAGAVAGIFLLIALAAVGFWPETVGQSADAADPTGTAQGVDIGAEDFAGNAQGVDISAADDRGKPQDVDAGVTGEENEDTQSEVVEITISAVGDLTFGRNQESSYDDTFDEYYDTYGSDYFFQNVKEIFEQDDFTIGNLEGTLTESTDIRASKTWNLKGRPEYADILPESSIEAVSLGNNHIMDYNEEGASDTFAAVEGAGVTYAISGEWGDQYGLYETEKGIKIGFVSVNMVYEGAAVYTYLEEGLPALRQQGADLVFAVIHWGTEKEHTCSENQKELGRWCIDQGYDLVLGSHPHVLQGIERYNGKYIVYSLGNFCFGGNRNPDDKETMIFQQTFTFVDGVLQDDSSAVRVIPCRISSTTSKNDYCPVVLTGDDAAEVIGHLNEYSEEFGIAFDEFGTVYN